MENAILGGITREIILHCFSAKVENLVRDLPQCLNIDLRMIKNLWVHLQRWSTKVNFFTDNHLYRSLKYHLYNEKNCRKIS